jgi:uncharacterized membrane protein
VYRTAAVLLGIGLGGLLDSIVLQQVLQQHLMMSAVVPLATVDALRTNLRWTGVVNAISWAFAMSGVISFYRAARHRMPVPSTRIFTGSLLIGWGGYNLVEGLLAHEILGLHHVVEGQHAVLSDMVFLVFGAAMLIALGALLLRPRRDWITRGRR